MSFHFFKFFIALVIVVVASGCGLGLYALGVSPELSLIAWLVIAITLSATVRVEVTYETVDTEDPPASGEDI